MDLTGKVIIITGASEGIGRALSLEFAARRALLVLAARSELPLRQLAAQIGEKRALAVTADVRRIEDIKRIIKAAEERYSRIDVLVNNAGVGLVSSVEKTKSDDFRVAWETNVEGPLNMTREALPLMRKGGGGMIVNVSSMVTLVQPSPGGAYRATKMALEALSEAARLELKKDNIRVIIARPGLTSTNFSLHSLGNSPSKKKTAHSRGRSAETVARKIISGICRESPEIHMSWWSGPAGKAARFFPGALQMLSELRKLK